MLMYISFFTPRVFSECLSAEMEGQIMWCGENSQYEVLEMEQFRVRNPRVGI